MEEPAKTNKGYSSTYISARGSLGSKYASARKSLVRGLILLENHVPVRESISLYLLGPRV